MAQIKISSKLVIEACSGAIECCIEKRLEGAYQDCLKLLDFAKYAEPDAVYLDHDDFTLIGDYLPPPVTYNSKQREQWTDSGF